MLFLQLLFFSPKTLMDFQNKFCIWFEVSNVHIKLLHCFTLLTLHTMLTRYILLKMDRNWQFVQNWLVKLPPTQLLAKNVAIYVQHAKGGTCFRKLFFQSQKRKMKIGISFSLAAFWPPEPIYGTKFSSRLFIHSHSKEKKLAKFPILCFRAERKIRIR